MPPAYVKAYVKRNKNDAADAQAICEAVRRPTMRFVEIKSAEQQGRLMQHRTRDLLLRQRTQTINALRAHMAELGTETNEQDFVLGIMERDQEVLGEISAALKRVEAGTYGQCEGCVSEGKAPSRCGIPKLRLKAIPWARNCVDCARKTERAYA